MMQRQQSSKNVLNFPKSTSSKGGVRRKRKCRRDASTHVAEMTQLKTFLEDIRRWELELREFERQHKKPSHQSTAGKIGSGTRFTGIVPNKCLYDLYLVWIEGEDNEVEEDFRNRESNGAALPANVFGEVLHLMGFKRQRIVDATTGKRPWCRKIPSAVNLDNVSIRVPALERVQSVSQDLKVAA